MYQLFATKVKELLQEQLGADYEVNLHSATKVNDTERCGLTIKEKGLNISPTIYLEEFYSRYEDEMDMEDIVLSIIHLYNEVKFDKDWEVSQFQDFQYIKEKLFFCVINREMNNVFLENIPYVEHLDFAIIIRVLMELDKKGLATILVNNDMLKVWGITKEEIFEIAKENTPIMFPMEFKPMHQVIEELTGRTVIEESENFLYVLSNNIRNYGAGVIFYENALEQIADTLQDNLILIPSSIHEWIIVPERQFDIGDEMNDMISEINETQVLEEDILGTHFYHYDRTTKEWK